MLIGFVQNFEKDKKLKNYIFEDDKKIQWDGTFFGIQKIREWAGKIFATDGLYIYIPTINGEEKMSKNQYLIRNDDGCFVIGGNFMDRW